MRYKEALHYLYALQKHGIKLGLDNPRKLLAALQDPQVSFKSVHVAGTNGKGSTTAAIASMLSTNGFRTGLFTSPHLLSFTERIRVEGAEITEEKVIGLTLRIKDKLAEIFPPDFSPTFFEFVTAMAFCHFREEGVAWAAVETGMGGRLDSTNVLKPELAVITPVGMDHKEFLGNTIREIAAEKAGIIKPGVPVVLGPQPEEALRVFLKTAEERSSAVHLYGRDFYAVLKNLFPDGTVFDYQSSSLQLNDVFVPLPGDYQAVNAATAIRALEALGFSQEDRIRRGLQTVRLPGRLELVSSTPEIRLDGGHNPEAAAALAHTLRRLYLKEGRRLLLVIGIMGDKDARGILKELLPAASEVFFTAPAYGRAAHPAALKEQAEGLGFNHGRVCESVAEALERAVKAAGQGDMVLVAGSFYTAREAKEILAGKGTLRDLRE